MRIEKARDMDNQFIGWHCVINEDDSVIAYCPDITTARAILEAEEMRRYLVARCGRTCAGREEYLGNLRHKPNCPAYDLGLTD